MTAPALKHVVSGLYVCSCLMTLGCSLGGGGAPLTARNGIVLNEGLFCGAGVVDRSTCRPGDLGGRDWQRADDLPPFTLSEFGSRGDARLAAAEVRAHYLGSLYYDGDLHSFCKTSDARHRLSRGNTTLQEFDLAQMIDWRVVRPLTTQLHAALAIHAPAEAAGISARFSDLLTDEVHERVQARIVWFVSRYQGGLADMEHDDHLQTCLSEARERRAAVVMGVAGYLMLGSQVDETISSADVVLRSLDRASSGYASVQVEGELRASLGTRWRAEVSTITGLKVTQHELTTTAWPMWVQLE